MVLGPADLIEAISITSVGPPPGPTGAPPPGDEASPAPPAAPVPPDGLSLDELPEVWSVTMSEALVRVGKLEIEGSIRRDGDRILPR